MFETIDHNRLITQTDTPSQRAIARAAVGEEKSIMQATATPDSEGRDVVLIAGVSETPNALQSI